jgi:cobalt-zinc-cadmium efflux system membrane fusion protein
MAILKLQQEYLECRHQLDYFSEELKRQGELALEKAASLKKLQETELGYKIWETRKASLEKQLALLGIYSDSLETKNLASSITVKAPVSGFFEPQIFSGAYIGPEIVLACLRIKTEAMLYAEIPENMFESIHMHQSLSYSLPGEQQTNTATVVDIQQKVDPVSHCFRIRILPGHGHEPAIPGMQAKVYVPLGEVTNDKSP